MSNAAFSRREFLKGSAWAAGLFAFPPAWANSLDEQMPPSYMSFSAANYPFEWTRPADLEVEPAVLALNRVAFGPRAGDVERVRAMGVDNYLEEQLSPMSIDDTAMDEMLKQFPSLTLSTHDLVKSYADAAVQKRQKKNIQSQGPIMDAPSAVRGFLQMLTGEDTANGQAAMPAEIQPAQILLEVIQAAVLRQMFSERQLHEMMVDFWSNHFNIYILKNECRILKTVDDRDVIRKYALAKFSDLLNASAHSPAMLVYLDNVSNVKGVPQENYARELMELHTLGVNGGYTQSDVQEVARCLTGWSINRPRRQLIGVDYADAGEFVFHANAHDDGEKHVLGVTLAPRGGIRDGDRVLDLLAHHPSTATFISKKLVQRFVADDPPASLVSRAGETFIRTDGDLRAVISTILHSDEFKQSFGQKLKRPLEYVASSVRTLSAAESSLGMNAAALKKKGKPPGGQTSSDAQPIAQALRMMGQVPFNWESPNGFPDIASAWINSNNLVARWNFSLALAANKIPGLKIDLASIMNGANANVTPEAFVDFWTDRLLHRSIPDGDRAKLVDYLGGDTSAAEVANLVALILASPHFQYR